MKLIVAAAIVSAFLFTGFNAHAEDVAAASTETSIGKGHWQIAGSASLTAIGNSDSSQLFIAPRAEYFVCDHMSLGGALGLYFYKGYYSSDNSIELQDTEIGPSATFYFSRSTTAPYFTQSAFAVIPKYGKADWGGISGLGVAFFANEHVSISPELDATYQQDSKGDLSLRVRIATYL